jgi:hypothetical protein
LTYLLKGPYPFKEGVIAQVVLFIFRVTQTSDVQASKTVKKERDVILLSLLLLLSAH